MMLDYLYDLFSIKVMVTDGCVNRYKVINTRDLGRFKFRTQQAEKA